VRQGYFDLAAAEPDRWVTVDATRPVEAVQSEIRRLVEARLEQG
jgi:thymidylate kinase